MKKLITLLQKEEWKHYVKNSLQHDFYHTWYYHSLDTNGDPILFVYQEEEDYIAFPLIRRKIPQSAFCDLTSVYGYSGPISNLSFENLDDTFMENFVASFSGFLKSEKYISVFSRLHPFFNQLPLMKKFGGIHENGKTVAIDLTIPLEEQQLKYNKRIREKIRQLKRKGYTVREVSEPKDIQEFANIYLENMKRIGASDYYLFTESYFRDLHSSDEFNSKLILVYVNGEAVSGAFIVCTNDIIQAHLLGTKTAYLNDSPAKLLTDEITIIGRQMGAKYFHLGGGLNFKEDSLFNWKSGFSDHILEFNSWRYIVNQERYTDLLNAQNIDKDTDVDFFPLYRYHCEVKNSMLLKNPIHRYSQI